MRKERIVSDIVYLEEMLYYIDRIYHTLRLARNHNIPCEDDSIVASLVMFSAEIGEQLGVGKLSDELKEKYKDLIPWKRIKDFRNFAFHRYRKLDRALFFRIIERDIPELERNLHFIINDLKRKQEWETEI